MSYDRHRAASTAMVLALVLTVAACTSSSGSGGSDRPSQQTTPIAGPIPGVDAPALTGPSLTDAVLGAQPTLAPENAAFFYERVPSQDFVHRVGRTSVVVAGPQNTAAAVPAIKATGARAYRYVQAYWYPANRTFDGLNIGEHPDLAFCRDGATPAVGRTDAENTEWWFVDMNEQAVQDQMASRLKELKRQGWDGVFFDRGYASLTGIDAVDYGVWNRTSSCTDHPVHPGATFADSYVSMVQVARDAGLKSMFNYGVSPFDATTPLRPDPRSAACAQRDWANCPTLDDAWEPTDWVLDEAASHTRDTEWERDFTTNRANEQDPKHGGQVVGLLTAALLQGNDRGVAYYEWARTRLFAFPVGVNTGDRGCPATNTPCNRGVLYPELVSVTLGTPIDPQPTATACEPGSEVHCAWMRRYRKGVVLVNVSETAKTVSVALGVRGCRYLLDVRAGRALAGGKCVTHARVDLEAWSGGPIQYSTKRF